MAFFFRTQRLGPYRRRPRKIGAAETAVVSRDGRFGHRNGHFGCRNGRFGRHNGRFGRCNGRFGGRDAKSAVATTVSAAPIFRELRRCEGLSIKDLPI